MRDQPRYGHVTKACSRQATGEALHHMAPGGETEIVLESTFGADDASGVVSLAIPSLGNADTVRLS